MTVGLPVSVGPTHRRCIERPFTCRSVSRSVLVDGDAAGPAPDGVAASVEGTPLAALPPDGDPEQAAIRPARTSATAGRR